MGHIDELEDFMEELSNMNLYEPVNKSVRKEISINSMYVADDEKQRKKMAVEFTWICRNKYSNIKIK